jgi:hypothetical protein
MANPLDLETLFGAIRDQIAAQFPALKTVEFDDIDRTGFAMPACLLDVDEFEGDLPDPGDGKLALLARLEARFVVGFKDAQAKLEVRKLAVAFATWINRRSFGPGAPSYPAEVVALHRDDFNPRLDEFECWCVKVHIGAEFGVSVWDDYQAVPADPAVFISQAPNIGPDHVADYVKVAP